nr:MAG TPA: 4Fe-4S single cluster domain protein [Caudoviricetes sp.]
MARMFLRGCRWPCYGCSAGRRGALFLFHERG